MPAAMVADNAEYDENYQSHNAANTGKSSQTVKKGLRENFNGVNVIPRSPSDQTLTHEYQPTGLREREHISSLRSVNGWKEFGSDGAIAELNRSPEETEGRAEGPLHPKLARRTRAIEVVVPAEETAASISLEEEVDQGKVSKLSPAKLIELTFAPDSLPLISPKAFLESTPARNRAVSTNISSALKEDDDFVAPNAACSDRSPAVSGDEILQSPSFPRLKGRPLDRPGIGGRATSTPLMKRKLSSTKTIGIAPLSIPKFKQERLASESLHTRDAKSESKAPKPDELLQSPMPHSIPLPPLSVPTHLHLELSSHRPSPLYLYRSPGNDFPYEPTHVKLERLLNFLLLPPQLEQVLWFGAFACLDAWLYTLTILPIRFAKAISVLARSWVENILLEAAFISSYVYTGMGRMWERRSISTALVPYELPSQPDMAPDRSKGKRTMPVSAGVRSADSRLAGSTSTGKVPQSEPSRHRTNRAHRRTRSGPSTLLPVDKADILKGLLIAISCYILTFFDASMMYHNIRGQAAIKLYVIYNALEVCSTVIERGLANLMRFSIDCSLHWVRTS